MPEPISTARHSYRKSALQQASTMPTNAFGQVVLSENPQEAPAPLLNVKEDSEGGYRFQADIDLFKSPHLKAWAKDQGIDSELFNNETVVENNTESPIMQEPIESAQSYILPSPPSLSELTHAVEKPTEESETKLQRIKRTINTSTMTCINSDCHTNLPSNARFCSQCGTPQLGRHCIHCGYHFESKEKFCPECGEQR